MNNHNLGEEDDFENIEKKHSRKKKVKSHSYTAHTPVDFFLPKTSLQPSGSVLDVRIADHTKTLKFNNIKSMQLLMLYLFTDKAYNPMWLTIKNQSKIQHCFFYSIEVQQYAFMALMRQSEELPASQNTQPQDNISDGQNISNNNSALKYFPKIFKHDRKAEFRESSVVVNIWDRLLSTENTFTVTIPKNHHQPKTPAQTPDTPQPQGVSIRSYQDSVYEHYKAYVLTPQELKENLYPSRNLPVFKDYRSANQVGDTVARSFKDKILCLDCEMVTTSQGFELAKITVINFNFEVIYDKLVKPENPILNYNTQFSGITQNILKDVTTTLREVQEQLLQKYIFEDTILIGHSLENDLNALQMVHSNIVDTALLYLSENGNKVSLKILASNYLKNSIQGKTHDSLEDATNTLALAKLRIEILNKIHSKSTEEGYQRVKYDVLEDLIKAGNSVLLCQEKEYSSVLKYGAHFEEIAPEVRASDKISRLQEHLDLSKNPVPKIMMLQSRFKPNIQADWQSYYRSLDCALLEIYNKAPTNSREQVHEGEEGGREPHEPETVRSF